jgi:hypothetical protein
MARKKEDKVFNNTMWTGSEFLLFKISMIFVMMVLTALMEGPNLRTFLVMAMAPPSESDFVILCLI